MNFPHPPPIASTLPTVPHAETTETDEGADDAIAPPPLPPPQRTIVPPPPPLLEEEDGEDHAAHHADEEEEAYAKHAREVGPEQAEGDDHDEQYDEAEEEEKRDYIGEHKGHSEEEFADHEDPDAQERVPPPPPRRFTLPRVSPPPVPIDGEDEEPVPPPPPRRVSLKLPPLPPHASAVPHIDESSEEVYERLSRSPDLTRHVQTHLSSLAGSRWACLGLPSQELGADTDELSTFGLTFNHDGKLMVGGCLETFSRLDAYQRHLKSGKCAGDRGGYRVGLDVIEELKEGLESSKRPSVTVSLPCMPINISYPF